MNYSGIIDFFKFKLPLKGAGLLYIAIIFNTLLGYIAVKLNTNFLSLSEFGRYSFFISTIMLSQGFFSFGLFESASRLMAVEKDKQRLHELHGIIQFLTLVSGVVFIVVIFIWSFISDSLFEIKIGSLLLILSPLVIAILFQNMLLIILRGSGDIKKLGLFTFLPRFLYILVLTFLALNNSFNLKSTSLAFLISILFIDLAFLIILRPDFSKLKNNLKILAAEVKTFGCHLYVANIASVIILNTDKIVLAYFLDADQLAYYSLAFTITVPIVYFSSSLSRSMYKQFANQSRIDPGLLSLNSVFVLTMALLLIIFRKFIIVGLFSPSFEPAEPVLVILAAAFGLVGLASPYTMFFKAQKRGKEVRNITLLAGILLLALSFILIPAMGIKGAALAVLLAYGFDYLSYLWLYRRLTF